MMESTNHTVTIARLNRLAVGPFTKLFNRVERQEISFYDAAVEMEVIRERYVAGYPEAVRQLNHLLKQVDPLVLLCTLNTYALITPFDYDPELEEDEPVLPHHVELLQALLLHHPLSEYPTEHTLSPRGLRDLTAALHKTWWGLTFRERGRGSSSTSSMRMQIDEQMRSQTATIRNSGSPDQVVKTVAGMFKQVDPLVEQETGVRVDALLQMCQMLTGQIFSRVKQHLQNVRLLGLARTPAEIAEVFCAAFAGDDEPTVILDTINDLMRDEAYDFNIVKAMFVGLSHDFLPRAYEFTFDDALQAYPGHVSRPALERVLAAWSLSFGDLQYDDPEQYYLNNPVWRRPIIHLSDGRYCWPIIGLFVSFCTELMEGAVLVNETLKKKYADESRSRYLERQVSHLFTEAFPGAAVYQGIKWTPEAGADVYETDILVVLDSTLLIVEAKSGRITESARRGSEPRIKREIDKLMVQAAQQSQRFASLVTRSTGLITLKDRRKVSGVLDPARIHQVLRVIITLDNFGAVGTYWPQLVESKLINEDIAPAPVLSLTDLENVLTILDGPAQRLHYFQKRSVLESRYNYQGDEMDLLAAYVSRELNFEGVSGDGSLFINMVGASKLLDTWLLRDQIPQPIKKPERVLTPWWRDLISWIEAQRFFRWTEAGVVLLNASIQQQFEFEAMCKQGMVQTRQMVRRSVLGYAAHILPGYAEDGLIVAAIYKGLRLQQLKAALKPYISNVKGDQTQQIVVIALDANSPKQPCRTMWVQ